MKPIPHLQTHQSGMIKRNEKCVKSWKAVQSAPAEGVQPSAFQSAICRWAQISPDFGANDIGESQENLYRSRHLKLNTFEEQPSAAKCLFRHFSRIFGCLSARGYWNGILGHFGSFPAMEKRPKMKKHIVHSKILQGFWMPEHWKHCKNKCFGLTL